MFHKIILIHTKMSIQELAEFYKHMLNICHCCRTVNGVDTSPAFCGWMRNRVTPYLTNGLVVDDHNVFVDNLDFTVEDYMEWLEFNHQGGSKKMIERTSKLLNFIRTTPNLINLIENNSNLFPTEQETTHNNLLAENWNIVLVRKYLYRH